MRLKGDFGALLWLAGSISLGDAFLIKEDGREEALQISAFNKEMKDLCLRCLPFWGPSPLSPELFLMLVNGVFYYINGLHVYRVFFTETTHCLFAINFRVDTTLKGASCFSLPCSPKILSKDMKSNS